ncbi:MAG TPA: FtsX-like permease family protein, partial [Draconibacterium sp.]|nr:FtsX-like permease family protein [Draconibacterium sp.]
VTGVMQDIPENSHLKFEMIFSMKNIPWILNPKNEWTNHSFFTYLKLKDGTDPELIEKKITESYTKESRAVNQADCVWQLQKVDNAYLYTSDFTSKPGAFRFGNQRMIYFLSIVTILLLSVSWINYINLITAKNNERLGEVKVRKVNGANKKSLLIQFFTESTFLNLSGLFIAAIVVIASIKSFTQFMSFPVSVISYPSFWTIPTIVMAASIIIPGLYTAFSLSWKQLAKKETSISRYSVRDVMVVFQFIIIVALLSSVIVINRQLNHISNMDLGFNKEQVLVINIPRIIDEKLDSKDIETFRAELNQFPSIIDVSATNTVPGRRFGSGNGSFRLKGQLNNDDRYFRTGRVLKNYPDLMNIKFIAGQSFGDGENKLVLNEAAVEEFGLNDPGEIVDKQVTWMGHEFTVAGVTENFHQESLHILPEPLIMYTTQIENDFNYILVRLSQGDMSRSMSQIEKEFKAEFPGNPFSSFFLDEYFNQQYQKDIRFRKLFSFFSLIALIIGYFGLYGLTTYTIIKRIKEIGIRKVNGAKVSEILTLLNKDFIKWVAVAFVIATPIAYYAMNKWLENFAYKTTLSWWIFALAGVLALGIALLTVSFQSWKAATKNPVESLRYE